MPVHENRNVAVAIRVGCSKYISRILSRIVLGVTSLSLCNVAMAVWAFFSVLVWSELAFVRLTNLDIILPAQSVNIPIVAFRYWSKDWQSYTTPQGAQRDHTSGLVHNSGQRMVHHAPPEGCLGIFMAGEFTEIRDLPPHHLSLPPLVCIKMKSCAPLTANVRCPRKRLCKQWDRP